jgi:predicted transposase YbfD/YdcC
VRSLIVVERTRTDDPTEQPEISYYLSSLPPKQGCAKNFGTLIRGHWKGCEIKNHWVRDHCMREDDTRLRGYNANCTLAALRACLIVIKSLLYPELSWPEIKERSQRHPQVALSAVLKLSPK